MSRRRKTLDRARVVESANKMLAYESNKYNTPEFRRGVAALLNTILHDHETYDGFNYLCDADLGPNETPGIRWDGTDYETRFKDTDETRVYYR